MNNKISFLKTKILVVLSLITLAFAAEAGSFDAPAGFKKKNPNCKVDCEIVKDTAQTIDPNMLFKPGGKHRAEAGITCTSGECDSANSGQDWEFVKSHYYGPKSEVLKDVPRSMTWVKNKAFVVGTRLKNGKLWNSGQATLVTGSTAASANRDYEVLATNAHVLFDDDCNLLPESSRKIYDGEGKYLGVIEPFAQGTTCPLRGSDGSDWAVGIIKRRIDLEPDGLSGYGSLSESELAALVAKNQVKFVTPVFDRDSQKMKINRQNCKPYIVAGTDLGQVRHNCPAIAGNSAAPIVGCFTADSGYDGCYMLFIHAADAASRLAGEAGKKDQEQIMRYAKYKAGYNDNFAVPLGATKANGGRSFLAEIDRASEIQSYAHYKRSHDYAKWSK